MVNHKITNKNLLSCIDLSDIICIEAESSYSRIHTIENKCILTSKTLKHWEDQLNQATVIKVHKSFVINRNFIKKIYKKDQTVEMVNGKIIPISRSHRKTVFGLMAGYIEVNIPTMVSGLAL